MGKKNYAGSINLAKLKHVVREQKGKNGIVKVVIIPLDANYIEEKDGNLYMSVNVHTNDEQNEYKQNGFISQQAPSAVYKEASDEQKEEFKNLPILGNIKDFSQSSNEQPTGAVQESPGVDADDSLPF